MPSKNLVGNPVGILLAIATVALPLAACQSSGTPAGTPLNHDMLTVSVANFGNESIDPSVNNLVGFGQIGAPMFDWLVWPKADGSLGPGVATSWTSNADGLSWTITVRSGMTFHNGDPLTADDVKFSMQRAIRPDATTSLLAPWRAKIASIDVISPDTVKVNLKLPWATFPNALSPYEGTIGAVIPKNYFNRVSADGFVKAPIGSGPWQFMRHDLGVDFLYKAVTKHPFRAVPTFKQLMLKLVPESSTRIAQLQSGESQLVDIIPSDVEQVKKIGKVLKIDDFTYTAVDFFVAGDPRAASLPVGKVEVRQALSLAIDRKTLLNTILAGYGSVPSRFIVGPGTVGYDSKWQPDPYDPAKAKQLLSQAGYSNGFTITMYSAPVAGVAWIPDAVTAIAGYWKAIGVTTDIVRTDFGTLAALYRKHPYPDKLVGTAMINIGQKTQTNLTLLQSTFPSTSPVWLLPNAQMDLLSDTANRATSVSTLATAITAMVDYAHPQYVAYPLALTPSLFAANVNLGGWQAAPSGYLGMSLEMLH